MFSHKPPPTAALERQATAQITPDTDGLASRLLGYSETQRQLLREVLDSIDGASTPASRSVEVALIVDLDAFRGKPAIDIDAIEKAAAESGRVATRKCLTTAATEVVLSQQATDARHYETQVYPYREAMRMSLASEVTDLQMRAGIQQFIFITEDEQFAHLSAILKNLSAEIRVICYGVRPQAETKNAFIRAFDSFRFYDDITKPLPPPELVAKRRIYAESLIQVVLRLEERHNKAVGAAWVPLFRDRHPEWSPQMLEFQRSVDLADFASELKWVTKQVSGMDYELFLTEDGKKMAKSLMEKAAMQATRVSGIERIRTAINEIFGTTLPDARFRFLAYNGAQWLLSESGAAQGGINLVTLSYDVVDYLGLEGIRQDAVYRLLNGIYRSGGFDFKPNAVNKHDPLILRPRIDSQQFDDAFVLNLLHMQKKYPVLAESATEDVSIVLYGTNANAGKVATLLHLASDPTFDRSNLRGMLAKL